MADNTRYVNGQLLINGEGMAVVPNSIAITLGKGTKTVKTAVFGTTVTPVYADNLDDAVGKVVFKLYPTDTNTSNMSQVQDLKNANIVEVIADTGTSYSMGSAAVTSDPAITFSSDGEVEYTMEGGQIV